MPIGIIRSFRFEGPNFVAPQPGVLLEAHASRNIGAALRNAIKDVGQQIAMVVAALEISVVEEKQGFSVRAFFATPTPDLGKAAVEYIIAGLHARETGVEWDADEQLEALQERQRTEALPFAALQIVAEAKRRGVPSFRRSNQALQLGYGAKGYVVDLAAIPFEQRRHGEHLLQSVPWDRLGSIPIIAVTGSIGADVAATVAAALSTYRIGLLEAADFWQARELLSQPDLDAVILDLAVADLLDTGLPFEACTIAAIGAPPALSQAHDSKEIAQAVALPMLVATRHAFLATTAPQLATLAAYASCATSTIQASELAQTLVEHAVQLIAEP